MVEMLETAAILNNMTPRSLILLDEIGRGTSTFDGMSIAWAIVEYIHERGGGAKTLFATHYHELNELEENYKRVKNFHIAVKESDGKILFLRKLCEGGVAHSFGIHVARLAGVPPEVVLSAEKVLKKLEAGASGAGDSSIKGPGEHPGHSQGDGPQLDDTDGRIRHAAGAPAQGRHYEVILILSIMKKFVKELKIVAGLVAESASFAFFSIKSDKLRTFLSLFGVTVGIFSIVAVFCAVDSLKDNIMEGVKSFGSDVVYIDRFPMTAEEDENGEPVAWWDYLQRPEITEDNFEFVARNATLAESVVYVIMGNSNVSYKRNSYSNAYLLITTDGLENVMSIDISNGRNFTQREIRGGANVAILGHNVAKELFGDSYPVGKKVKIKGSSAIVIGVLDRQGESMASMVDTDNAIILPLQYGKTVLASSWGAGMMMASPAEGADRQEFLDELRVLMRTCRGLAPSERDDFAINEMTFLLDMLDSVFRGISRAGWIIGAFSLIIGGFGIANIMFVSVQERMSQIGIQKALGAKRYVILTQFMVEASFLSLAGGLTGILLVLLVSIPVNAVSDVLTITLSPDNALAGMLIAVVLGILSGLLPAWKAATLDPVKAICA